MRDKEVLLAKKRKIMLFNVKITVTNEDNKEIFNKESKIKNSFFRNNKELDAKFLKVYTMTHNDRKQANYRQFDELTAFSVFLNSETSNIKSIDNVINDAIEHVDSTVESNTASTVKTAKKDKTKKDVKSTAIDKLKAANDRMRELSK